MKFEPAGECDIHFESSSVKDSGVPSERFRPDSVPWSECWSLKSIFKQVFSLNRDSVLGEHAPILIIIAVYVIAMHAIGGIRDKIVLIPYYGSLVRLALGFSAVFIGLHIPKKSYRLYLTPRHVVGFWLIVIIAPLFISAFSSYKQAFPLIRNFSFDYDLMRLDYFLHLGHHPWRLFESILSHPSILIVLDRLYMVWFLFLFLFCLCMAWSRKRRLRLCFFVSMLLVWIMLGSGLGTVFSSAGPCYYSSTVTATDDPFAPLMTELNEIHQNTFLDAIYNQHAIWEAKVSHHWLPFGGISAMPSIHLAMATLFMLLGFSYRKWLGIAFAIYLCLIQIGSVILGWHYAIDGYVGIILTCLIWVGVKRMLYKYIPSNIPLQCRI